MENETEEVREEQVMQDTAQEEHDIVSNDTEDTEQKIDYAAMVDDMKNMMGKMENRIEQLETSISTMIEAGVSINDAEISLDSVEEDNDDTEYKRLEELDYNI